MTHKYTQGPWKAVFKHGQSGPDYYSIVDNGGVKLCEVLATGAADLMAAAPDMLEALEGISVQLAAMDWENSANWNATCRENAFLLIDNAITKAKGEVTQ